MKTVNEYQPKMGDKINAADFSGGANPRKNAEFVMIMDNRFWVRDSPDEMTGYDYAEPHIGEVEIDVEIDTIRITMKETDWQACEDHEEVFGMIKDQILSQITYNRTAVLPLT